jgi:hypothetical protein
VYQTASDRDDFLKASLAEPGDACRQARPKAEAC